MAELGLSDVYFHDLRHAAGTIATQQGATLREVMARLGHSTPSAPSPISVTGGLSYHGGRSSNYMGHAVSHLVDDLRSGAHSTGLVTGVGMHMTKQVAAVWSNRPGRVLLNGRPPEQHWYAPALEPDVAVVASGNGPATALAATVVHARDGSPEYAVAICELADGTRSYARSTHDDSIAAVLDGTWVSEKAQLCERCDGTTKCAGENRVHPDSGSVPPHPRSSVRLSWDGSVRGVDGSERQTRGGS